MLGIKRNSRGELGSEACVCCVCGGWCRCPLEATRIRLVSNPSYASSMVGAMSKMAAEEGFVGAFYSGFVPILAKQVRIPTRHTASS
jgi:hypothetical protein